MTIAHSDADGTRGNHRSADRDREFVLDAQAWNSIAARIMMSSSSSSSSGGGSVPSGGTARKNLTRSWNYGESSRHRQSSRHARVEDNETECHEDENDRGDVDQERVSLVFGGGMTRSKSTPSLRNEARSTKDDDGMDAQPDGVIGNDGTSNENNNNNIINNKRSTSRRRQVLGSWLQSRAASAASSNPADRDGDTASKSSWKSKLKSMRSKSTPRSRSRSSSQPQPQPRPQSQSQRLPGQRQVPHTQQFAMAAPSPRSAPLDTSHLKFRNTATNSSASTAASTATTASSTPPKQTMINKSKSAKSPSFHNSKRPTPDNLAKAAFFSNDSNNYNNNNNDKDNDKNNDKNNGILQTCNIHPEVRIRRNKCPLCAAEQTKKLRRSFHGNVHHRGSANDAAAATFTPSVVVAESRVHAPKVDRNGNGNGDGQPVDNVAVTATSDDPAAARTTKSHPDLQHFVSSNIEIEADSRNGGKLPPQQQQQQQQQRQFAQPQHSFLQQQQQSQLPHRYPQEQQGKPPIYAGNNNNNNISNADEDVDGVGEFDSRSEESSRGEGGNVVDGIIHNFLEKMRLLSSQHGQQHPERQRDRDEVEEERDNRLNDGNFQNCRGDGANKFDVRDGHRDNQDDHNDDDVADHRGDYTGYINPHDENSGNVHDQHGVQDECNDDHNSLRGCYGPQNNHHIQYKYQHSFDDDVHVSKEGIWRSRPFEDRTLPAMLAESECFQEHKHSFYSEEPTSGEWKESKASYSFVNDNRLLEPTSQLHSMVKDGDAIVQPSLKSSLSTLSELQETILLATKNIGKFSPSEDEYDDFDFLGDDHRPMDEYHDGDGNDELFHQDFGRISPSNSLEGNKSNYLPKGLHHHITSRISDNDDKNATFDDDDCCSQESTDDEGSISSMARRGDQPVKRFAESKGSFLPFGGVAAPPLAEEKYPNVYDELEERSQFYQQRESAMTRQVCPQHERLVQQPSEPPMEVDCDSNSSGSSVTMDEFSSSRSLSSKSSFVALEKREKEVDRMDHIASKENEVDKESEHVEDMPPPSANRVSFTVEDEAEFPEVEGDVPVYDSERLIPKPKNAEDNISPCSVILNDDNSGEVQLPFGPPFSKVESYSEAEAGLVKEDSEVCDQPKEVNKSMKTPVEGKPQAYSQRQGRPTKRSSLRSSLKQDRSSRRSSSGAGVEAEDVNIDAECDETDISRTGFKPSHQPSFFSALVQNSRQARSLSKSRTRARSRSKSRTRKAAKVVAAADPKHNADFQQNADVLYAAKIDENENMKDIGCEKDLNRTSVKAQNDGEITSEPLSANIAERKTTDETPKKRKKKATKPDPPRNIRGPIAHPYYKLGDVARDEDMIVFPKKNSRSRRRRRHRRRHRSKSRTASLSSSDSSCSSDSDRDSDNESDDDSVDEREAKRKHAIYMSIKELRHLDAAFVKRSDGTWTYAIVCDWIDDEVRFVVNGRGSTKSIPQNIWRSNVRRIKVLSQRSGDNFISKDSSSRKKRTIGRGRSSSKSARAKGRMVSPSPTRRTSTMNYMPTIAENKRYN